MAKEMSFTYIFYFKCWLVCLNKWHLISKACFQASIQVVQTISRDISRGIKGACKPASSTSLFFRSGELKMHRSHQGPFWLQPLLHPLVKFFCGPPVMDGVNSSSFQFPQPPIPISCLYLFVKVFAFPVSFARTVCSPFR